MHQYQGDPLPYPIDKYIELAEGCPYIVIMRPFGSGFAIHGTLTTGISPSIPYHRSDIQIPLRHNYPIVTEFYAVLTIDMITCAPDQREVIPLVPPRILTLETGTIPRLLHQSFETLRVPTTISNHIERWKSQYPEWQYHYHTGYQGSKFIQTHFPPRVGAAYRSLYANAYRGDLWRACQLFITGGLYADIKLHSITPFSDILATHDLVLCLDVHPSMIYNAIMAAPPHHPFFDLLITMTVENIETRSYGGSDLGLTGPLLVYKAFHQYLGHPPPSEGGSYRHPDGTRYYLLSHHLSHLSAGVIRGEEDYLYGRHLTHPVTRDDCYRATGKHHYSILYRRRQVYEDEN